MATSKFTGINRPTAGARSEKELPKGKHPFQLYSLGTPNGIKVTILLEELGEDTIKYDAWRIDIMAEEQFTSGFVAINPNSKIPAAFDYERNQRLFESGSILLYLAEKYNRFIPKDLNKRAECLNWLFHQMGSAPFIGQFGHFYKYCSEKIPYAIDRYTMETQRLCDVLDQRLRDNEYLVGDEYTIADIAWYPWIRCIVTGYNAAEQIGLSKYKHLNRWVDQIGARPAVQKGQRILGFTDDEFKFEYHSSL